MSLASRSSFGGCVAFATRQSNVKKRGTPAAPLFCAALGDPDSLNSCGWWIQWTDAREIYTKTNENGAVFTQCLRYNGQNWPKSVIPGKCSHAILDLINRKADWTFEDCCVQGEDDIVSFPICQKVSFFHVLSWVSSVTWMLRSFEVVLNQAVFFSYDCGVSPSQRCQIQPSQNLSRI